MPCYSIVLNTVELENVGDHDLLEKSLKEQYGKVYRSGTVFEFRANGYSVTLSNGVAQSSMPTSQLQTLVGEIKQGYSRAAVHATAKRFGWIVKKGRDANHFQIVKP